MLIRKEFFGNLIWSDYDKCYYVALNKDIDLYVTNIIDKKIDINKKGNDLDIQNVVLSDLIKMGYNEHVRIIDPKSDVLSAPLEYYYDYTDACNLKCQHCYNRKQLNHNTMTKEQIEYVIMDMYNNGVMRLHLAGGEPTLYKDRLNTYMSIANKLGIMTSMSSNGTTFDDDIGKILIENNVTSFTISIESAIEEKNASIRGTGVLKKACEGIKKAIEYRKSHNGKYNITIKMSYDVNTTREDFVNMIELAIDLNVDILKLINPERCEFHEERYYSSVANKYFEIQAIIRELREIYKDKLKITIVNSPVNLFCTVGLPKMKGCIGAQELIAINPDGKVTPCLMNKYDLGNIFDGGIKHIYRGNKISQYRNKISDYDCSGCKYHAQCRGGCQVRKKVEYGDIKSIDPLCPIKNKVQTKDVVEGPQKYKNFKKINVFHSL